MDKTSEDMQYLLSLKETLKMNLAAPVKNEGLDAAGVKAIKRIIEAVDAGIKALGQHKVLEMALEEMAVLTLSNQGQKINKKSIKEMCEAAKKRGAVIANQPNWRSLNEL